MAVALVAPRRWSRASVVRVILPRSSVSSTGPSRTVQRMNALYSALSPIHMKATVLEIDLAPSQGTEFSGPQSMSVSQ